MEGKTNLEEFRKIHTHSMTGFINILFQYGEKYNVKVEDVTNYDNGTSKVWCSGKLKDLISLNKKAQKEFKKLENGK